eukprot:7249240-Prymnesium_polylepis.2
MLRFARFGVSTAAKVVICRVLTLHPMSLYYVKIVPITLHERPPCVPTDHSAEIAIVMKLLILRGGACGGRSPPLLGVNDVTA